MSRTQMTRSPDKASRDRNELDQLLDEVPLAHVGFSTDEGPVVIPTAAARDGDRLMIHGSTGSQWMRRLATGVPACAAVTSVDAVVVARSGFESSYRYRSAVIFGCFTPLDGEEKHRALDLFVDRLIPGRVAEIRPSTSRELAATLLLALPLNEWSLRVSKDWPEDGDDDVSGPAWAGIVPMTTAYGDPLPAPDLRNEIQVPASLNRLRAVAPSNARAVTS